MSQSDDIYVTQTRIDAWEFAEINRTEATLNGLAKTLSEVCQRSDGALQSMLGTSALTFPDQEFPNSSPLADKSVQLFLKNLFVAIPHILYFLSSAPEAVALHQTFAACAPDAIVAHSDGSYHIDLSPTALLALVNALRAAGFFAEEHGGTRTDVLHHLNAVPDPTRTQLRELVLS